MKKIVIVAAALIVLAALRLTLVSPIPAPTAAAQTAGASLCPSPERISLQLGLGDTEELDWSGSATGWVSADSQSFKARSTPSPLKLAGGAQSPRILPATVSLELPESPCGADDQADREIRVETAQGEFEFGIADISPGSPVPALDGRVEISRIPAGSPIAATGQEEDYPHCVGLRDSSVLCAFALYSPGRPIDEQAALAGEFSSIEFEGNGDRVALLRSTPSGWNYPVYATPPGRDVWRPVVTELSDGERAVVAWSEQRNGNWDVYSREYRIASGVLGPERRHTTDPRTDFNVAASGDFIAWQGRRDSGFDIFASRLDGKPALVSASDANDWRPSIGTDSSGAAWIAWDTYDAGNYDVYLRRFDGTALDAPLPVAVSPRFEARASVAVDGRDRVWVAFEDSDVNWGKDYGDRWTGQQATAMYVNKHILVRVWDGSLKQTAAAPRAPTVDYHHDDTRIATSQRHKISIPSMAIDAVGRPWVLFRKHPLKTGRGERWRSFATYYSGDGWSAPIPLNESDHLLDRQPGLAALPGGDLVAVFAGDKRLRASDRKDSDLFAATLRAGDPTAESKLGLVDAAAPKSGAKPVHPDESAQIARLRGQRVQWRGKTLRFLRGEFHRHSAFSSHRDWDGPFEDVWRYGLDVAAMEWIGPGDHEYAVSHGYLWWLQQKTADIYHSPGDFTAVYTYERNVNYPSGHRNVMLPRRGIRPLPRMRGKKLMEGTEQDGSPDIQNLFAYLKHFGAICSSHTSATNMGTDWRDWDRDVEPVVELFQGHRQSYEVSGGPTAATGPDDTIQGYRPAGFIWEAFQKGRRLGFQASSDHVSTHLSYGIVLAEDNSRDGIIQGFKARHSYAAHDNIALVVRSGEYLMGDEFSTYATPRLQITALGTAPIDSVEIIRQVGTQRPAVVASMEPRQRDIDIDWSDQAAVPDEWNMYYVRLKQRNEAMAWASPLWIRYEP